MKDFEFRIRNDKINQVLYLEMEILRICWRNLWNERYLNYESINNIAKWLMLILIGNNHNDLKKNVVERMNHW